MTVDTLFGPETIPTKPKNFRLIVIKSEYETPTMKEEVCNYLLSHWKRVENLVSMVYSVLGHHGKQDLRFRPQGLIFCSRLSTNC